MKKSLLGYLLVISLVFLTACQLLGVSKPDTSYEGYLQVKKGLSLKDIETLLGKEIEILSVEELEVTTNQTEERRIYQDQEEADITYRIEFDKNQKVLTYSLNTKNNKNAFLIKQSADFSLERLESLVTLDFDKDAESDYCLIKPEQRKTRTEVINKLGKGVPGQYISNKISYYLEDKNYMLHFDDNDLLSQVDQSNN